MPISLWPISSGRTFGSSRSVCALPTTPSSARWLHKVAEDKIFGNAFSERGSLAVGSLVFNTRLLPADGGGYRLDGEKYYRTGTLFSDYLTVATTTDHDSVATVAVPVDRVLVRLIDDWDGFGQRRTGTTVFTNVAVSNDEVLSDTPYDAAPVPTAQHASLQLFIHAVVAGIPASVVDDGIALLRSRDRSFSHALAERPTDDPMYHKQLGELASTAYIAKAAVLDAAEAIAAATASELDGVPDAQLAAEAQLRVAKVKVHLDDVAPEAATRLLEPGGASAASRQRNLDRHWRNIRTNTLHNPVAHKARVIGQNLLHGTPVPAYSDFGVIGYAQRDRARRNRGQLLDMPALASHFLAMSDRLVPLAASAFIEIRSSVVSFAETAFSVLVMVSFCLPDLISGTTFSAANRFLSSSRATRWLECRPGSVLKRSPAWI